MLVRCSLCAALLMASATSQARPGLISPPRAAGPRRLACRSRCSEYGASSARLCLPLPVFWKNIFLLVRIFGLVSPCLWHCWKTDVCVCVYHLKDTIQSEHHHSPYHHLPAPVIPKRSSIPPPPGQVFPKGPGTARRQDTPGRGQNNVAPLLLSGSCEGRSRPGQAGHGAKRHPRETMLSCYTS